VGLALKRADTFEVCAIAQDMAPFDGLTQDLEAEFGPRWGGLDFSDALLYLKSPEAATLRFVTLAVRHEDEQALPVISNLIAAAHAQKIKVILVVDAVSTTALHLLLRNGADDFLPYPIPAGALHDMIARLGRPPGPTLVVSNDKGRPSRGGVVIPFYGLAGGVGTTTIAVNLASELSLMGAKGDVRTCVLDLDLQFGSVSTYLDLPRREAIFEMLSDIDALDHDAFLAAMLSAGEGLDVFTAPSDSLPLEILGPQDVEKLLDLAREAYDFVIVDMPSTLVSWTETLITRADLMFAILERDLRSAQNTMRFMQTLLNEDLPIDKVKFILNRAPKRTDIAGRARIRRLAENVGFDYSILLPDGGKQVVKACDQGVALSVSSPKNPVRKEIAKFAATIFEYRQAASAVAQ